MGYDVLEVAVKADPAGTQAPCFDAACSKDKTTLVLGPSGMGKSTLVNLLVPHADAQVGEISKALKLRQAHHHHHHVVLAGRRRAAAR